MRTKICSGECGQRLPLNEIHFALRNKKYGIYRSDCKTCFNAKQKLRYLANDSYSAGVLERTKQARKRNRMIIVEYLKNHCCVDCGETDGVVLEFDHVIGKKNASISKMVSDKTSVDTLMKEVEKCEVVCANCHRKRTAKRAGWDKNYV